MTTGRTLGRILVMLDYMGPGDALRISSCLTAIRSSYPNAEIVLLAHESVYPLFTDSSSVNRVVASRLYRPSDHSRGIRHVQRAFEIVRLVVTLGIGFDLVLILGWGTTTLNVLARIVGKSSIGYAHRFPNLLSTHVGYFEPRLDEIGQNHRLLDAAGIRLTGSPTPLVIHNDGDAAFARELLRDSGVLAGTDVIIFHPGSDWACQQWVPERWAELGERLIEQYSIQVVFTGLDSERKYIDDIRARMQYPSVSLAGRTTLKQLGALVSLARLCICVDTIIHELTQAANTPAIVLAGPSSAFTGNTRLVNSVLINRTSVASRTAINACREPKFQAARSCFDYACPLSGLLHIQVDDVLDVVHEHGVLTAAAC